MLMYVESILLLQFSAKLIDTIYDKELNYEWAEMNRKNVNCRRYLRIQLICY